MSQAITAHWATETHWDFLTQAGVIHLPTSIVRRKIDPFIATIWVVEQQNQGAGRAMLHFLEIHARTQGCDMIYSSSQLDEAAPQAWHRHVSFVECGILAAHNDEIGEVFFRKLLR